MPSLLNKVSEILKKRFPLSNVELEQAGESKKIGGFLIWPGFKGKDHVKRQQLIWDSLEKSLSSAEQKKLSAIFTMTPDEAYVEG